MASSSNACPALLGQAGPAEEIEEGSIESVLILVLTNFVLFDRSYSRSHPPSYRSIVSPSMSVPSSAHYLNSTSSHSLSHSTILQFHSQPPYPAGRTRTVHRCYTTAIATATHLPKLCSCRVCMQRDSCVACSALIPYGREIHWIHFKLHSRHR